MRKEKTLRNGELLWTFYSWNEGDVGRWIIQVTASKIGFEKASTEFREIIVQKKSAEESDPSISPDISVPVSMEDAGKDSQETERGILAAIRVGGTYIYYLDEQKIKFINIARLDEGWIFDIPVQEAWGNKKIIIGRLTSLGFEPLEPYPSHTPYQNIFSNLDNALDILSKVREILEDDSVDEPVPPPPPAPLPSPVSQPAIELITNGNFENSIEAWQIGQSGYGDNPVPVDSEIFKPNADQGFLQIEVYGGARYAFQEVFVSELDLQFSARVRVQRWSLSNGQDRGWVAIGVSFVNEKGHGIATTNYYLSPHSAFYSRPGINWIQLGETVPTQNEWYFIDVNIEEIAHEHLNLDPEQVTKLRITAYVFGAAEDRTPTIAHFDDFSLTHTPKEQ
ncbi:hypothetical protein ACFLRM_00310 [Acidobacteriota bacterium]